MSAHDNSFDMDFTYLLPEGQVPIDWVIIQPEWFICSYIEQQFSLCHHEVESCHTVSIVKALSVSS